MKAMADPAHAFDERYTYGDYRKLPEGERRELIDGVAYSMSPAHFTRHQTILGDLYLSFRLYLQGKHCRVFLAPFDVLFPAGDEADDEVDTVVQPDIVVICDKGKITERGARGAPDLVVEIFSTWTSKKDLNEKFRLYEKRKVREYWVLDPGNRSVQVWRLDPDGRYDRGELRDPVNGYKHITSRVLDGFAVDPTELFRDL